MMRKEELENIVARQKLAFQTEIPSLEKRLESLKLLSDILDKNKEELISAVSQDFGLRSREETLLLELYPLQDEIRHAIKNVRGWMKKRKVAGSWFLFPSNAFYQYQPKGCVGIMSAWNYQIMLSFSPMIDAIAAGNHIILKPSEIAPASAEIIRKLVNENFSNDYIHCVTGDAELSKAFSSLNLDHLFFTGSTNTGRKVMEAAAPNLTPVTLELGGKSPAIIHQDFGMELAANRIMTGKLFNAGQTCVAPDYVILPHSQNAEFEKAVQIYIDKNFAETLSNNQYSHIISERHHKRLHNTLTDALEKGARIVELYPEKEQEKLLFPKLVFNVTDDMKIMQEEIFGPILPVVNLETIDEAMAYVNERPNPLALYYFDTNKRRINNVINGTFSGGVTINDTIYHLAQHNLPFGGNGESGMGNYHGFDGFQTFSKKKAVMVQKRLAATDYLHPPYGDFKQKLLRILGKLTKA